MQDEATDKLGNLIHGQRDREDAAAPDVDLKDYELPF